MSKTLQDVVKAYVTTGGKDAKTRLALDSGVSVRLIEQIVNAGHVPKPTNAYKIAMKAGATEEEARKIALLPEATEQSA
jgi:2-keto-3-deoxy-galactonokinase